MKQWRERVAKGMGRSGGGGGGSLFTFVTTKARPVLLVVNSV